VMALGLAGFAQQPDPTAKPTTSPPAAQQKAEQQKPAEAAAQDVMIAGCVQSEAEYRRAQDAGKGGVAGTGVGAGNEFVLINASMAGGAASADASGSKAGQPTGTAGVSAAMSAYELTGANEGQLAKHVGKRVEITGKLKAAEIGASGPTGGPTAGAPPRGVDVTSEDLKLLELEVMSVRETTGACPAAKS